MAANVLRGSFNYETVGDYTAIVNDWGVNYNLPAGTKPLVYGQDYGLEVDYGSTLQSNVQLVWGFPNYPQPGGVVYGYPEIVWGSTQGGGWMFDLDGRTDLYERKLSDITSLKVHYNVGITGDRTKIGVFSEIFVTDKPIADPTHQTVAEVSVWFNTPYVDPTIPIIAYKDQYISANMQIAVNDVGNLQVSLTGLSGNPMAGDFDYRLILNTLISRGVITAGDYVGGVEIGAEPSQGSGTLQVNAFSVQEDMKISGSGVLISGDGNDVITGTGALNTASYQGAIGQYAVTASGAPSKVADSVAGRDGTDTLANIQQLKFSDITLVYDLHSTQDLMVYEIYQAAYGRTPDNGGFRFWADFADKTGIPALAMADKFLAAPEFAQVYGAKPTNMTYVTGLYTHVLGRAPDANGLAYWVAQADAGQPRDALLVAFATSLEDVQLIGAHTNNGYWTTT